jgi:S-adenosylmethionine hydrolase
MKGRILVRLPNANIIDVTHDVSVYWPAEAGFWLKRAYHYFPAGTLHLAIVDPGVGTSRGIVAVKVPGHTFLAPDNGLLAPIVASQPAAVIHRVEIDAVIQKFGLSHPSATFHGRDIFAPLGAEIASGRATLADLGPQVRDIVPSPVADPVESGGHVTGVIIAIDHFGNLISNIDERLIRSLSNPVVQIGEHRLRLRRTYGDAAVGELLALVNSFGVVEIAQTQGSAAAALRMSRGQSIRVSQS